MGDIASFRRDFGLARAPQPPRKPITPARLRESEQQCRRIVETAQEGIWQIDAADRTMFVNQKLADLLATAAKVAAGR